MNPLRCEDNSKRIGEKVTEVTRIQYQKKKKENFSQIILFHGDSRDSGDTSH